MAPGFGRDHGGHRRPGARQIGVPAVPGGTLARLATCSVYNGVYPCPRILWEMVNPI